MADHLEIWTARANVPLARFAHRARAIQATGLDFVGVTEFPSGLTKELRGFDSIVSWYGAKRAEFRDAVAGLPFTFFPALPQDHSLHATDFYLEQARTIVPCASDGIPRIRCDVQRENFAVIHPFSGSPRKNWPLEKFRVLAARFERSMTVYWCAGPEDPPLPESIRIDD